MALFRKRGLGWHPDPVDSRDHSFDKLGLVRAPAGLVSVKPHVLSVLDQGSTSSCVANAWEQGYRIRASLVGGEWRERWGLVLGSRLFGYRNARRTHGEEKKDEGTFLRSYAKAVNVFGRPPEHVWPFDAWKVNTPPSWNAYRLAFDVSGPQSYYRIEGWGPSRVQAIRAALASGYPVVFGTPVSQKFLDLGPGSPPQAPPLNGSAWVGGHAMCLVSCDEANNGEVVNSWGTGWGNAGFMKLTQEWLEWQEAADFWAVG